METAASIASLRFLNLFMFSMLTLVLADNFLLMFVGWEGVGLCSYLLIGYYTDRKEAGDAAKKAFITNRVGDWGFVLGIMLTFFLTGSISFFDKPAHGVASALQNNRGAAGRRSVYLAGDLRRRRHLGCGAALHRRGRQERADSALRLAA